MTVTVWTIIIIGLLFIFEVPQTVVNALKSRKEKGEDNGDDNDDDDPYNRFGADYYRDYNEYINK